MPRQLNSDGERVIKKSNHILVKLLVKKIPTMNSNEPFGFNSFQSEQESLKDNGNDQAYSGGGSIFCFKMNVTVTFNGR